MYDVIFKNGNVVDVKNEQILQADIAVKDGKIAGIGHFSSVRLTRSSSASICRAASVRGRPLSAAIYSR